MNFSQSCFTLQQQLPLAKDNAGRPGLLLGGQLTACSTPCCSAAPILPGQGSGKCSLSASHTDLKMLSSTRPKPFCLPEVRLAGDHPPCSPCGARTQTSVTAAHSGNPRVPQYSSDHLGKSWVNPGFERLRTCRSLKVYNECRQLS